MDTPTETKTPSQETSAGSSTTSTSPPEPKPLSLSLAISDIRRHLDTLLETDVKSVNTWIQAIGPEADLSNLYPLPSRPEASVRSLLDEKFSDESNDRIHYDSILRGQVQDLSRTVVSRLEDLKSKIMWEMGALSGDRKSKIKLRQYWVPENSEMIQEDADTDVPRYQGDALDGEGDIPNGEGDISDGIGGGDVSDGAGDTASGEGIILEGDGDIPDDEGNETLESLLNEVTKVTNEVKAQALAKLLTCTCDSAIKYPRVGSTC